MKVNHLVRSKVGSVFELPHFDEQGLLTWFNIN